MTMLVLLQALNVLFQLVTPTTCKRANYPDKGMANAAETSAKVR